MELTDLIVDDKMAQEGVWVPIGDGAEVKVAYSDSPEFIRKRGRMLKPYMNLPQRSIAPDGVPSPEVQAVSRKLVLEYILLDWRGIMMKGVEVPYRSEERRVGKECRSRWSP